MAQAGPIVGSGQCNRSRGPGLHTDVLHTIVFICHVGYSHSEARDRLCGRTRRPKGLTPPVRSSLPVAISQICQQGTYGIQTEKTRGIGGRSMHDRNPGFAMARAAGLAMLTVVALSCAGCSGCPAWNRTSTGPTSLGTRLDFGKTTVFYTSGVEESAARKVGESLAKSLESSEQG